MQNSIAILVASIFACAASSAVCAQSDAPAQAASTESKPAFDAAADDIKRQLDDSIKELSALRDRVAAERLPLVRQLGDIEQEVVKARQEAQQTARLLETRTFDLSGLTRDIKAREEEVAYLGNLLVEYLRNFESGLHITELQRFRKELEGARLAAENEELPKAALFRVQSELLATSIDRLQQSFGGAKFDGSAVGSDGTVLQGTFILTGPAALFRSADGAMVGTAEQRLGSLEPSLTAFESPELVKAGGEFIASGAGAMPFDPSLGMAHKIAQTEETLFEHIQKGGPIMVPIFALAGAALLVALYKWVTMFFVRMPSERRVREVLKAVAMGDKAAVVGLAGRMKGPMGRMLSSGAQALGAPREVIEEQMFEVMHRTQLRMQSMLPFVAISAAAAPLLGLLGTVTGIMNTFSMIEIYGTGDVKTLSGGISEALITTEYGLIVAIPSLLLHAYLSSKARKISNRMETTGIAFLNESMRRAIAAQAVPVAAAMAVAATESTRVESTKVYASKVDASKVDTSTSDAAEPEGTGANASKTEPPTPVA
jgi:biopolymer transport protein ExbB